MTEQLNKLYQSSSWGVELRRQHLSGELKAYLPEVDVLYGIPQPAQWHPEICTGWHMELCLDVLQRFENATFNEFCAVLFHDLGKGITPKNKYPSHHSHEAIGVPLVEAVCKRLNLGQVLSSTAAFVCKRHLQVHTFLDITDKKQVEIANNVIALGVDEEVVRKACFSDAAGRLGKDIQFNEYSQGALFERLVKELRTCPVVANKEFDLVAWSDQHRHQLNIAHQLKKEFKQGVSYE